MANLSVVIPNYNHGHLVRQALEATLSQSHPPLEVIIIDDGSTDDSVDRIQGLLKEHPEVRLVKNERNTGVVPTVNRGLDMARGDYVFFPAADDRVLPGLFQKSMDLLSRYPQAGMCSALTARMDEEGRPLKSSHGPLVSRRPCYFPPSRVRDLLRWRDGWFNGATALYRRDHLLAMGGMPQDLGAFADGFVCRVLSLKCGACFIPEPLALKRRDMSSYSQSTLINVTQSLEIMRATSHLMRTRYGELFDHALIQSWERNWLRTLASHVIAAARHNELDALRSLIPNPTVLDNIALKMGDLTSRSRSWVMRGYFRLRYR